MSVIGAVTGGITGAVEGAVDGFTGSESSSSTGSDFSGLAAIFDKAKADNEEISATQLQGNTDVRAAKIVPQ